MNKKGLSVIVIVVSILIAILIAAIAFVLYSLLTEDNSSIDSDNVAARLNIDPQSVEVDSLAKEVSLKISKAGGGGSLDSIKFIISNESRSYEETQNTSLEELEGKVFRVSFRDLSPDSLESIIVVPIVNNEKGEEVYAGVAQSYSFEKKKVSEIDIGGSSILSGVSSVLKKSFGGGSGGGGGGSSGGGSSDGGGESVSNTSNGSNSFVCGDGVIQGSEQCDDGNLASGDGCSSTCQTESVSVIGGDAFYVRPLGGSYGLADGSSYNNAWIGFSKINWSLIKPGDSLYICEEHSNSLNGITINASGTDGKLVEIRGDCKSIDSGYENGVIWAGYKIQTTAWEGQVGEYWYKNWTSQVPDAAEGDVGSEVSLIPCKSLSCVQNTDRSFYWSSTVPKILYYNPSGTQLKTFWGFTSTRGAVHFNGKSYIAVRNLTLKGGGGNRGIILVGYSGYDSVPSQHWEITGNDLSFAPFTGIYSDINTDYGLIDYNKIHDMPTGTYFKVLNGVNSDNLIFSNNELYSGTDDVGIYYPTAADRQALGGQCGDNLVFDSNYIHDWLGDGINIWMGSTCTSKNVTIKNNVIINLNDNNNSYVHKAIAHTPTGADSSTRSSDWKIHNNIIWNCGGDLGASSAYTEGIGIRVKAGVPDTGERMQIYNNVVGECNVNFGWVPNSVENEIGFVLKNNIFYTTKSGGYHVRMDGVATSDYSKIIIDYNLYYPDSNFQWANNKSGNFSQFINDAKDRGVIIEANSIISDPKFVSSNLQTSADFKLQSSSPAIDAGDDVGLLKDIAGNSIVGNSDIGAYEFI